jgi:hypothetical protein
VAEAKNGALIAELDQLGPFNTSVQKVQKREQIAVQRYLINVPSMMTRPVECFKLLFFEKREVELVQPNVGQATHSLLFKKIENKI